MSKTGVLLVNLGTPDSPKVGDVRKYLSEFLNDPRVIDLSPIARKLLVNLIIVPFRAPKSAKVYQELWTDKGSPLLYYGIKTKEKLQNKLGGDFEVELAMRYQNPSMDDVLGKMRKRNYKRIIIFPLFPQYASATSGSVFEKAMNIIKDWWVIPEVEFVHQFFDNEKYIQGYVDNAKKYPHENYDHVIFSFHGLPVRHLDKVYNEGKCADHSCEEGVDESNYYCYKATCYATAKSIADKLNIPKQKYTVCFQSRLGKDPWIEPYADQTVEELVKGGAKKILAFSPAFIADCLETTIEIGDEYQEIVEEFGGEKIQLVESLNDSDIWIEAMQELVLEKA